jgi:hypothetical protein
MYISISEFIAQSLPHVLATYSSPVIVSPYIFFNDAELTSKAILTIMKKNLVVLNGGIRRICEEPNLRKLESRKLPEEAKEDHKQILPPPAEIRTRNLLNTEQE